MWIVGGVVAWLRFSRAAPGAIPSGKRGLADP